MPYKDKQKQKAAQAKHYIDNRQVYRDRDKARIEKNRAFVREIKKASACVDCGEDRWQCLDFDHIDPSKKSFGISAGVKSKYSIDTLQKEIDKCEIRCANCHRVRTWDERHYDG